MGRSAAPSGAATSWDKVAAPGIPRLNVPVPVEPVGVATATSTGPPAGGDDPRVRYSLMQSESLETRLQGLTEWLLDFDIEAAFVVDSDGLALIHHEGQMPMMAAAAAIQGQWEQMSHRLNLVPEKAMVLHLSSGSFLHLLGANTRWGRLCLGLLGQQLLSRASLSDIRTTFDRLVGENSGNTHPGEQHGS